MDSIPVETRWEEDLPVLLTPRLVLRIAHEDEAPKALGVVLRNRSHMQPWEPIRPESFYELPHWERTVVSERDRALAGTSFRFRLLLREEQGAFVGGVSLRDIEHRDNHSCEIGYYLDAAQVGRGLMLEAVTAVVGFALGELDLMRIQATYMPRNTRSERLLAKLGFEREGLLRKMLRINGRWEDHVVCSLLNPDWKGTWKDE